MNDITSAPSYMAALSRKSETAALPCSRCNKKDWLILSFDTSCDDTSVAVTLNDRVLSNVIASQVRFHQPFGGIVPNIAKRMHLKLLEPSLKKALKTARVSLQEIEAIAVTYGPGLAPALEAGINFAKALAKKENKPLIGINHMEAHLLAPLAKNSKGNGPFKNKKIIFHFLGLLVSGGHTQLVLAEKIGQYQILGQTLDDAAGEAFDKVARLLDLGYPGGAIIEKLARLSTDKTKIKLPIPMINSNDLNYSFSGLKTAARQKIEQTLKKDQQFIVDFAAAFELTIAKSLTLKLNQALKQYPVRQIFLGGGVINNQTIRREIKKTAKLYQTEVFIPFDKKLISDNAAMIGITAYFKAQRNQFVKNIDKLDRKPGLTLNLN